MRSLVGLLVIGLCLGAIAAEKPAVPPGHPAVEQPALPAGHPALPATNQANPALPPGHPQLPGTSGSGLPSGHPQIPGAGGVAGLPSGHPQINPVPAPPGTKGSITIKAVQATKGGPPVGADPVLVEYYNEKGDVAGRAEATLSAKGDVTIKDVPLTVPVQPLITVTHGGIEYKAPGTSWTPQTVTRKSRSVSTRPSIASPHGR